MSVFYVIGSNSKIENIDELNLGFNQIDNINKFLHHVNFEKRYYYVSNAITNEIGYDIKNLESFYNDENKNNFIKFIDFIKSNLNDELEFYKFWSIFDKSDEEINYIYYNTVIDLSNSFFPDDKFEFNFQTKYIFKKDWLLSEVN